MADPYDGVAVRDPDASLIDRARYGLGTTALVVGFVALIPGLIGVGLATMVGPVAGVFLPTFLAGIAALAGGLILQAGLEDPAISYEEMTVFIGEADALSAEVRAAVDAQSALARRLLDVAIRLDGVDDDGLDEVILVARRVAYLAAVDLSEAVPSLAGLVAGNVPEASARTAVEAAHARTASGLKSVEHMVEMLPGGDVPAVDIVDVRSQRRSRAQAELQAMTDWVSSRQQALRQLDPGGVEGPPVAQQDEG